MWKQKSEFCEPIKKGEKDFKDTIKKGLNMEYMEL